VDNEMTDDARLKATGYKKLKKPYLVTCPECGCEILRGTNIPTKACHCGAKLIFGNLHKPSGDQEND